MFLLPVKKKTLNSVDKLNYSFSNKCCNDITWYDDNVMIQCSLSEIEEQKKVIRNEYQAKFLSFE